MRPHTETVAKPMLPVRGKPFVEHQLSLLRRSGIERILFLAGYLGEQLEAHFGNGSRHAMHIRYSFEPTPLGTGGALRNAAADLETDFLLLNGDTLLDIDYASFARQLREKTQMALIAAFQKQTPGPGNLLIAENGLVLDYSKQDPRGAHVDAGVVAFRKRVIDLLPPAGKCSLEEEVYPQVIAQREMAAFPTSIPFFDMGTPAGFSALEAHLG